VDSYRYLYKEYVLDMLSKDMCGFCSITTLPHGTFGIRFRNCFLPSSGLSKVAGCWQKSPPTWLVSAGYSAWHFFMDMAFFKNKISLNWLLTLTTQLSTSKLCDNLAS